MDMDWVEFPVVENRDAFVLDMANVSVQVELADQQ